ncbi:hypothetical protein [Spirillospora sp. CA-294931]|uniref:hypothetical protein n=1 Tax=Spirillospora sp. CA-294931 TaxID=3240042 RepID=UPI003D92ECCC
MTVVRVVAAGLMGVAFFGLAACGDDGKDKPQGGQTPQSPGAQPPRTSPPSQPSSGGTTLTGTGVKLTLPSGWKQVDPTQDTSEVVTTTFGATGEFSELVKELQGQQKKMGTVWALDGSVTSGYAPHVQAGCDKGGLTGASLEQLKRKQSTLTPGSQITDLTVDGKPGFKSVYSKKTKTAMIEGKSIRVPIPGDRFCYVEVESLKGKLPAQADQILASFKVT